MPKKMITNRYQIVRPLGEGGMGEVFLVEDRWERNRQVALKKLRREILSDTTRDSFIREFTALKQLHHPNIASVYDFGYTTPGDPFFTSEYCPGPDLITGTVKMSFSERVERAVEICRALSYIHTRGYIHADLKPENILVVPGGFPNRDTVKLLDFGLAQHVQDKVRSRLSGTLAYLAPEVFKGRSLDVRTDLYALGVVLYQLFTRQLPFGEIEPALLIDMQLSVQPASPTEKDGTLPLAIDSVVLKLLDKNPEERFSSADEVISVFNQKLGTDFQIETRETTRGYLQSGIFVGREKELGRLTGLIEQIQRSRQGRMVLVNGESGIGKTRILEEFKLRAQLEGVRTFTGASHEKINQPLQSFLEILPAMAMSLERPLEGRAPLLEKYESILGPAFPEIFGWKGQDIPGSAKSAGEKEFLLDSLAMFIREACADQPTLILIQDIHSTDALSLELIYRIGQGLGNQKLILALSYRTEEVSGSVLETVLPDLLSLPCSESISLAPLTEEETHDLIGSMLGADEVPRAIVHSLLSQTRGNPFFIQEVLWSWLHENVVSPKIRDWESVLRKIETLPMPATMVDAFLRRIRHLTPLENKLLQIVALFDEPLPVTAITGVASEPIPDLEGLLQSLVEASFLARLEPVDSPRYALKHAQMRKPLLAQLPDAVAVDLHERIAKYYEDLAVRRVTDYSEALAYHYAASGNIEKARRYSIQAGDKLRRLFSYNEAIAAYRNAEGFLDVSSERWFEVQEKIAFCLYQLGNLNESEKIYRSLITGGSRYLTPLRTAKLHLRLAMNIDNRGNYAEAIEVLDQGYRLIEDTEEHKTKADLLARIGHGYQRLSNYRLALDYVLQAISLVEHYEDHFGLGDIYNELFLIYFFTADYGKALEAGNRAIAVYSKFGWLKGVAGMTANLGLIYEDHLSDYDRGLAYQRQALQIREKIFDWRGIEQSFLNLASILGKIGKFSAALDYLERADGISRNIPEPFSKMIIANHRGENWTALGQFEKAQAALAESLQLAEKAQHRQVKISTLNRLAEWHERLGEWTEAKTLAGQAVQLANQTESKIEELRGRLLLARLAIETEDWAETQTRLDEATSLAQKMNHLDWILEASILRAEMHLLRNETKECQACLRKAKPQFDRTQLPLLRARYLLTQGKCLMASEDRFHYAGAEDLLQALRAAEMTEDIDLIAQAHDSLGRWYQKQGDPTSAQKYFSQARTILLSVGERLAPPLRKKYLEKRQRAAIFASTQLRSIPAVPEEKDQEKEKRMPADKMATSPLNPQSYFVTLFQISEVINSILNLNELLERVMDLVLEAIRVERGLILLVNEESGELEVKAARNISKATLEDATAISKTVLDEVLQGGRPLISVNAHDDQRLRERHSIVDFGIGMVLCFPLRVKEKVIGAVYIDNPVATLPFTEGDVNFLTSFTNLFAIAIENARLYEKLHEENLYLRQEVRGKYAYENIIGHSPKMVELFRRLDNVVLSSANVLVYGESGTGKELIARAIHYNGSRKEKRFIAIDCGSIPENLIESELFGYKKGAFTGALFDKKGLFEEADGGTIFLDEITNTNRALQAKLLRVVQEREIRRVGDSVDRKVDVRIIAATNRDLRQMVLNGEFREDLFYRLNVLNLTIPPLRERIEDVPLLIKHILKRLVEQNPAMPRTISRQALQALSRYSFPGNVRELENLVESAYYMAQHEEIQIQDFPSEISGSMRKIAEKTQPLQGPSLVRETPPLQAAEDGIESSPDEEKSLKLYERMKSGGASFWDVVKEPFMRREISKEEVREVIKMGLKDSRGRYKDLLEFFHLETSDYTVFMNFLRKHGCQIDYRPFREATTSFNRK